MDGNTHSSHGSLPPSITEKRESDPDKDLNPERGTDAMTTEAFAEDEQVPLSEVDECPECGEEYDAVPQHFAQAHPEAYADYKSENEQED